jgi:mRNA interferase MazF
MERVKIHWGGIYLADLGESKGFIQGGVRPVVVVSNQANNKFAPIVNVLPITSSKTKKNMPVHVDIDKECGLLTDSVVLTEQIQTINKTQLLKLICICSEDKMVEIAQAIMLQTQLLDALQLA